jgi:hypothetical protein
MTETNSIKNKKEYSKQALIFGNLTIILWISLAALSWTIFQPITSILFFALNGYLIFYEIGKHGCINCYYCKTCTIGMGKLPDLFFKVNGTTNVNKRALKVFRFTYLLLGPLTIIYITFSLLEIITTYRIILLITILSFSVYTGIIRRRILIH